MCFIPIRSCPIPRVRSAKLLVSVECGGLGSALYCAAYRGHVKALEMPLDHGVDHRTCSRFKSAVYAACQGNREDVVLAILKNSTTTTSSRDFDQFSKQSVEPASQKPTTRLRRIHLNNMRHPRSRY